MIELLEYNTLRPKQHCILLKKIFSSLSVSFTQKEILLERVLTVLANVKKLTDDLKFYQKHYFLPLA